MKIKIGQFIAIRNSLRGENRLLPSYCIVERIKKVSFDIGRSAFVETSDLLSIGNGDNIHFCR